MPTSFKIPEWPKQWVAEYWASLTYDYWWCFKLYPTSDIFLTKKNKADFYLRETKRVQPKKLTLFGLWKITNFIIKNDDANKNVNHSIHV